MSLPLTPPYEVVEPFDIFADNDTNDGGAPVLEPDKYSVEQSIGTPISENGMGLENRFDRSNLGERSDSHDLSDEDRDMSEGGVVLSTTEAPLTMTLSHAEELNAELDMLDTEIMGHDNLNVLLHDDLYSDELPFYYSDPEQFAQNPEEALDDLLLDGIMDEVEIPAYLPMPPTGLPPVMSEVSQQLQHIQNGQEHADPSTGVEGQHAAFIDNSTLPPSFHSVLPTGVGSSADLAMADVYSVVQNMGSHYVQNTNWVEGLGPSPDIPALAPNQIQHLFPHDESVLSPFSYFHVPDANADDVSSEADQDEVDDQVNLSMLDFLYTWGRTAISIDEPSRRTRGPIISAINKQSETPAPKTIKVCDLQGERCDIQGIDWKDLGITRWEARQMRRQTYRNYTNLRVTQQWHPRLNGARLSGGENYFKFRRMGFDHDVHLAHFQLRNLLVGPTRDHIYYAGRAKVMHYTPTGSAPPKPASVVMDLTKSTVLPFHNHSRGIQISTLTAKHDVLVAGGFGGEYAMVNLRAPADTKHTEGLLTYHHNAITNHVQVHLSRTSSLPLATFASNDEWVRILDVSTNTLISERQYDCAINCTSISPDQRLRVLVGDKEQVLICHAETGEILQQLDGHRDYGFACDWADDGVTIATGNQDMQVKIWDARKWKHSSGKSSPVATISAEMAGVRQVKFSPLGSGKRVLMAAEPADFVNLIDAETFTSKQTLNFFGEIAGADFTNDGQDLMIANSDAFIGGIMEFERCGLAIEASCGMEDQKRYLDRPTRARLSTRPPGYDWKATDREVVENPKSRGTQMQRRRRAANLGTTLEPF